MDGQTDRIAILISRVSMLTRDKNGPMLCYFRRPLTRLRRMNKSVCVIVAVASAVLLLMVIGRLVDKGQKQVATTYDSATSVTRRRYSTSDEMRYTVWSRRSV